MSDPRIAQLEQHLSTLQADNQRLQAELDQIRNRQQATAEATKKVVWGGAKLLLPLIDRNKVVRSFGALTSTMSEFAGPTDGWPERERVLGDARVFAESCVRFAVRRRTLFWVFSVLAAAIPIIQLYVVIQQNQIIENQNEFFEIQVHDVVARSMTEGDRNARLMTGALLSRANLSFLGDVVEEAFDPDLAGIYDTQGVNASTRRLEDAAFRGFLVRAVARGIQVRADEDSDALLEQSRPMIGRILRDAADRIPATMRLGEKGESIDGALAEQVENYIDQTGALIRVYGRLARQSGDTESFEADLGALIRRLSSMKIKQSRFGTAYRFAMERVAFEMALEPELRDPAIDWDASDLSPTEARDKGIEALRAALGDEDIAWDAFADQIAG